MNNEMLNIDNQLCFRLYAVSRKMTRLYQPLLQKFNLTYPQYIVMLVLFEHREIDFHKLSDIVDLKTGTLTPIIDKLVENGFVRKEKNKIDKRKVFIILTSKGITLHSEIIEVPITLASKAEISVDMYNVLVKELDSLSKILNNAVKK
jgi:DNA-binding MarR family transcriptional regulator